MITFKQLEITPDKSAIKVAFNVDDLSSESDDYVDVLLYHYTNTLPNGECANTAKAKPYQIAEFDEDHNVSLDIPLSDISSITDFGTDTFDKELFFVEVLVYRSEEEEGEESSDSDAVVDQEAIGIIPDWKYLYSIGMAHIVPLPDRCSFPTEFTNFSVLWLAFKLACEATDYQTLIDLWKRFRRVYDNAALPMTDCGCKN